MCGIAGIFDTRQRPEAATLDRMLDVLVHRGPDGSGTYFDGGVALGHRRLSIIDISNAGAQPMEYADSRYAITYNGEVYNYVELREELEQLGYAFRSHSDTEVLLAAYASWGEDCLNRFNGMFAFAIWDKIEGSLFCARDRLGVKPFTYTWDGHRFAFASETKALIAGGCAPGAWNPEAIYEFIARGYTTGGRSFHRGVSVLQPGHCATITSAGDLRIRAWWQPVLQPDHAPTRAEWTERIAELLQDAVCLRLRSDVPVGAHLSGGLDSSAIASAAARHAETALHTFTGAFTDDAFSDERQYSRAVNEASGLIGHEVEIGVDELGGVFDRIVWHMDEPIAGPGVFPQMAVCDLVAEHGIKVVLGGQGGDELFGGYLRHRALHYKMLLRNGSPMERARAGMELAKLAASEWRRVKRTSTRAGDEQLSQEFLEQVPLETRLAMRQSPLSAASAPELMLWDLQNYLPALLHVEDRTSMAASIESRTPILDYRLVELALTIPEQMLFAPGDPKPLLREAVAQWLPKSIVERRDKKGFPTPLQHWAERPALKQLVESLTVPTSDGIFAANYLKARDTFSASELWTVMMVQGWMGALTSGAFASPLNSGESLPVHRVA
jgi:asparagine synthase (glutamine-hydrolysing)